MEKIAKVLFIISIILFIGAAIFFICVLLSNKSGTSTGLVAGASQCKTLSFSSKQAKNIVFFSNKEEAEKYKEAILSVPPFESSKGSFNFYYIDSYRPNCTRYQGEAIFCYSKSLIKISSECPNDYIIVVSTDDQRIRSTSYLNVLSLNSVHPDSVMIHEFGHAFASLDDEYTPAQASRKSKNCFKDCKEFNNLSDGCFQGCGDGTLSRSIDQGIMRTLSSNSYGKFDEYVISKLLPIKNDTTITGHASDISTASQTISCADQEYYLIVLEYSKSLGGYELLNSKTLERGCAGSNGNGEDYNYSLLDGNNDLLETGGFNTKIFSDSQAKDSLEITGGVIEPEEGQIFLKIKADPNIEKMVLMNGDQLQEISLNEIDTKACIK